MEEPNQQSTSFLKHQFSWLQELIMFSRYNSFELSFSDLIIQVPLPNYSESERKTLELERLKLEYHLSDQEYFLILLSLSPYFIPSFFIGSDSAQEQTTEIGNELLMQKSLVSKTYQPTIDTALQILGGNLSDERQHNFKYFMDASKLIREELVEAPSPPYGEPLTRAILAPTQSLLRRVLNGTNQGPEFSHDFPATLIDSDYTWKDLILDYDTRLQLEEVKEWLEYMNICEQKNLELSQFKKGYKCLFHGPPGTGKTMAASLIGKLTDKPVYRIDLSAVVSKYIGETEKNLAKVFDRASHGNWILFFDEADALFGKRSATQSAHDRYANQEVSYLLQRFENYDGVSILASNFKENIDSAFYRRFHSIVRFKAPEADERKQLWQVHLPQGFKFEDDVNINEISQKIKITGSGIYNVMRRSCMKAVLAGDNIIRGNDMYISIKQEFAKENKTL